MSVYVYICMIVKVTAATELIAWGQGPPNFLKWLGENAQTHTQLTRAREKQKRPECGALCGLLPSSGQVLRFY